MAYQSYWIGAAMTALIRTAADIAPELIDGKYEVYRVVTDYEGLQEGFVDRVDDLKTTRISIDEAAGFAPGYSAKVLCTPPMKTLGRDSVGRDGLGKMLKATGMALILVIDDERFAAIKEQLAVRKRPSRSIVRQTRPTWLFTRSKASQISKNRWSSVSPAERSKIMKRIRKAASRRRPKSMSEHA